MQTLFCYDDALVPILFPGHRITTEELYVGTEPVVLAWRGKIPARFESEPELIVRLSLVMASVDIKLLDRASVVQYVGKRLGLTVNDALLKRVTGFKTEGEFFDFCKMALTLRRFTKAAPQGASVFSLFQATLESRNKFARTWFEVTVDRPWEQVWGSLITFLARTGDFESQRDGVSESYRKILFAARGRFDKGKQKLVGLLKRKQVGQLQVLNALLEIGQ